MAQTMQGTAKMTPTQAPRQTPGITAVGWLLACFAVIPVLYGVHQFDRPTMVVGGAMAAAGAICVLIGRIRLRRQAAS